MKKALKAGIKYCENERQSTVGIGDGISRYICYVIERVLREMLAAIDEEEEKQELSPIKDESICCSEYPNCYHAMQNINPTYEPRSQPEKTAIDPEIKKVYDHWKRNDGIVVIERAFERDMWNAIKAHVERGE